MLWLNSVVFLAPSYEVLKDQDHYLLPNMRFNQTKVTLCSLWLWTKTMFRSLMPANISSHLVPHTLICNQNHATRTTADQLSISEVAQDHSSLVWSQLQAFLNCIIKTSQLSFWVCKFKTSQMSKQPHSSNCLKILSFSHYPFKLSVLGSTEWTPRITMSKNCYLLLNREARPIRKIKSKRLRDFIN